MKKHIRPLSAFKRHIEKEWPPGFLDSWYGKGKSAKGNENEFYFNYCMYTFPDATPIEHVLKDSSKDLPKLLQEKILDSPEAFPHLFESKLNPFFLKDINTKNNISTVTALGRLMLTGWYYNVKEFTNEVVKYVYRSYNRPNSVFEDLTFAKSVDRIRENIGYYYHNQDDLKLFILQSFFKTELEPLLPPKPELLQIVDDLIQGQRLYKARMMKNDKDYFFKKSNMQEMYIAHLEEILNLNCIPFPSYEDFEHQQKQECEDFKKEYSEVFRQHQEQVKGKTLENANVLMQA